MKEVIVEIHFNDQLKYESNKGFLKDIMKRQFGLSNFDAVNQRWYNLSIQDVEVQRVVDSSGLKTTGLKVVGDKNLADALVNFVKDIKGIEVNWTKICSNPIDDEVNEIVNREKNKISIYYNLRVRCGYISRELADSYISMWINSVSLFEYTKRGIEY